METESRADTPSTHDSEVDRPQRPESPTEYAPGAARVGGNSDVSAAESDTETADTGPVYQSDPGGTTGDTAKIPTAPTIRVTAEATTTRPNANFARA